MLEESPFHRSRLFEDDPVATAEEIEQCGLIELNRLDVLAAEVRQPLSQGMICAIHRGWFHTTFPQDAGVIRRVTVLNRKGTAIPFSALESAIESACGNWQYRLDAAGGEFETAEQAVAEANEATVAIYDAHPFVDGNTRTTWHLRNYLLMLNGFPPLRDFADLDAYEEAWWSASATQHEALDAIVLSELLSEMQRLGYGLS